MNLTIAYAREKRREILNCTIEIINRYIKIPSHHFIDKKEIIDLPHNFASVEEHFGEILLTHRKGATAAKKNDLGLIPGSMGTFSYLVEGKEFPYSFMACSHGSGRKFSRTEAKKRIPLKEFQQVMKDIIVDIRPEKKDEDPQVYKNINDVMKHQKDCIRIIKRLTPLMIYKG